MVPALSELTESGRAALHGLLRAVRDALREHLHLGRGGKVKGVLCRVAGIEIDAYGADQQEENHQADQERHPSRHGAAPDQRHPAGGGRSRGGRPANSARLGPPVVT
ncbi:MAG TPA: hypothetical protein VFU53_07575 [Burkholderiales bacterium]|nr:hypothetical protein [Burkholderiales bacterium]